MPDYSTYKVPRPVEVGREVRLEQRRSSNRAALFALAGVLVLCVCLCVGITGAAYSLGIGPFGGTSVAFQFPLAGATATPTISLTPTAIPLGRSAKNDAGLSVTVSAYQRPLPAQDVEIPEGQELALVTLRIENTRTTGGPIKYSPDDFKLVSPDGDEFSPVIEGVTTGELLKAGEVAPRKSVRGDLVYYIYSDIEDLELSWILADGTTRTFKLTRQ